MNIPRINAEGFVPPARSNPDPVQPSPSRASGDVFKPEQNEKLMNLLRAEPDARPLAVERARGLVADPTYPSIDVLEVVARGIILQVRPAK